MTGHDGKGRRSGIDGMAPQRRYHRAGLADAAPRARVAAVPAEPARAAERAVRRIWDVDPDALQLVMGVLLSRPELEACFARFGDAPGDGTREDALRQKAVLRCTRPCVFAEKVEAALADRAAALLPDGTACPMIELAARWTASRERLGGPEAAAFLWRVAREPQPHLAPLVDAVAGDLRSRALGLLRADRGVDPATH